jgi:putative tricarboxylic transport membrane protein
MFAAGIAGYYLRRSGYSVAGIVLGLVLGEIGESAFVTSMQLTGYSLTAMMQRPACAILLTGGALTLLWNIYREVRRAIRQPAAATG